MIFPLAGLFLGAAIGALLAKRKGGKMLDLLQWAAVNGIIGFVIGMFVFVILIRATT